MLRIVGGVILGSLGLGLAACGSSHSSSNGSAPVMQQIVSPHPPAGYNLEDPACQTSPASTLPLTGTTIHSWSGGKVSPVQVSLASLVSTQSLTGPSIKATTYKDLYERTCDYSLPEAQRCEDQDGNEKGWLLNQGASPGALRICQDDHAYDRVSVEGVALTAAYFIQHARARYTEVTAAAGAKAPDAIGLSVLPNFVDYYENFPIDDQEDRLATYYTHNLAYFPSAQMIAVFPERADRIPPIGYFWESAFVLAHEYGHHIDFTRHGEVLSAIGLKWSPAQHSYIDVVARGQGLDSATGRAQIAGALAEGFADMMAYYANGASSDSLTGIQDIGFNRDVGQALFADNEPKILTTEQLNILMGLTEQPPVIEGGPVYSDIHIVGAVIAHTADSVFSLLTAANPALAKGSAEEVNQRYALALSFMDNVVRGTSQLSLTDTSPDVLAPISQALAAAADGYLGSFQLTGGDPAAAALRQEICKTAQEALPAMPSAPFANGTSC